jgi:hypothetical protein
VEYGAVAQCPRRSAVRTSCIGGFEQPVVCTDSFPDQVSLEYGAVAQCLRQSAVRTSCIGGSKQPVVCTNSFPNRVSFLFAVNLHK